MFKKRQKTEDSALPHGFASQAKNMFARHPDIEHAWCIAHGGDECVLEIPKQCENGYPIAVHVNSDEITIIAGDAHSSRSPDGDPDDLIAGALHFVCELLSPTMRIHEWMAGGKTYRWAFERLEDGRWRKEEWGGLLFWNYFGKRTERTLQNRVLLDGKNPVEV